MPGQEFFDLVFAAIERSVLESDPELAIGSVLDVCEAAQPHPDWAVLRRLPFATEIGGPLSATVANAFATDPPSHQQLYLWFGMYDDVDDPQQVAMYVSGATELDEGQPVPVGFRIPAISIRRSSATSRASPIAGNRRGKTMAGWATTPSGLSISLMAPRSPARP